MHRRLVGLILIVLFLSGSTPLGAKPPDAPPAQGGAASGSFGDPGDAYLEFSISGADLHLREGTPASYEGPWNGGPITLSGVMTVDRTGGTMSYVTMSANAGDQTFHWPPEGEDNRVEGRVVSQPFNLTFDVPPGYSGPQVTGGARLEVCGGVCGVYAIDFRVDLPTPAPSAEAPAVATAVPTQAPSPTPQVQYRLAIESHGPADPLHLRVRLEKQDELGAGGAYRPVPDAQVRVLALDWQGNEGRLAQEFVAPACDNCQWRDAGRDRLAHLAAPGEAILLRTGGQGEAELGLFLDFAALGGRVPTGGAPLAVPIAAEYQADDGQVRTEQSISLDAIAVVTAITYQEAQNFDPGGNPLPRNWGPLSGYLVDPGTRDGSRTLSRDGRVRLARAGGSYMGQPGQTLGDPLAEGELLRVGDQVSINACDMVTNRIQDGLPAGAPGTVWVRLRFFDGLRAKVGVNGSVCRTAVLMGQSPGESSWLGEGEKFFYWSANGAASAVIGSYFWPYKIVSGLSSAGKALAWLLGNEAAGWEPVYIKVKSALVVEFDEAGVMQVTTREGEPEIVTQASGEPGVAVPVGTTAYVAAGGAVELFETGAETARRADEALAGLDPLAEPAEAGEVAGEAEAPPPVPGDGAALPSLALPALLCGGGAGLALLLGVALVARRRSGRRPGRAAEDDWELPAPAPAAREMAGAARPGRGEPQRWHLWVVDGPDMGREFPLAVQARLGRSAENEVHLADPQASRHHALLRREGGRWLVEDLGSSNGTFVDGQRIAGAAPVGDGSSIAVGRTTLRLVARAQGPEAVRGAPGSSPARQAPPAGAPVAVIASLERRKGLVGSESFALVVAPDRLVFARLTPEMMRSAVEDARREAKARGQGLLGQWGAQLGAGSGLTQRYLGMTVDAILREHPDNFQLRLAEIEKVRVRSGRVYEDQADPDRIEIQAGGRLRFALRGTDAGKVRQALGQVLGGRVK